MSHCSCCRKVYSEILALALVALATVGLSAPALASDQGSSVGRATAAAGDGDPIAEIRAEIAALRQEYAGRLAGLEGRLAALEGGPSREADDHGGDHESHHEAGDHGDDHEGHHHEDHDGDHEEHAAHGDTLSHEAEHHDRSKPEFTFTAILLGVSSDVGDDGFKAQVFNLRTDYKPVHFELALAEGEVEIEELFFRYPLSGNLGLTVGKLRQKFGPLNHSHRDDLPQTDYPLTHTTYFDNEGLRQNGISLDWRVARPWASANEITLQLTDGASGTFGGEEFERLTVLGRLRNTWDLSPDASFDWGLTGAFGETGDGGDSQVLGTDLTLHWQPERAADRELTWRTEVMLSERDDPFGVSQEAWGGYSYIEGLVRRNVNLGVRYDRVEDPFNPERRLTAFVPYLTWWQNDFVRLRGEYQRREDELSDETENRFVLQLTLVTKTHHEHGVEH